MAKSRKRNTAKVNFNLWLMEWHDDIKPIGDIINLIAPIKGYLPNLEDFIIWLMEVEDGFFDKQYGNITALNILDFYNSTEVQKGFIDGFETKLNLLEPIEKVIYIKILLTRLQDAYNTTNSIYLDAKAEKENNTFKRYSINDYWNFSNGETILKDLINYFNSKFIGVYTDLDLPFEIIDKRESITWIDDPYPNIDWYIEQKETTQTTQLQKEVSRKEKIKWNKKTSLLAYLFYKLETEKMIIGGTIPANLSQIFTDNLYKDIEPKSLQKAIAGYKSNVKAQGKEQIDEIVELIKSISQKLD